MKLTLFQGNTRQYGRNDQESKSEEATSTKPNKINGYTMILSGANSRDRTDDLRITNALLYQLSYVGLMKRVLKDIENWSGVNSALFYVISRTSISSRTV